MQLVGYDVEVLKTKLDEVIQEFNRAQEEPSEEQ